MTIYHHPFIASLSAFPDQCFRELGYFLSAKSLKQNDEHLYLKQLDFYQKYFPYDLEELVSLKNYAPGEIETTDVVVSQYKVKNPSLEGRFKALQKNNQFKLSLWVHDVNNPRPIVLCLHGFLMGHLERAKTMFKIEKIFKRGADVAFFPLPLQGERSSGLGDQQILDPANWPHSVETLAQAVHDLHWVVGYLKNLGHPKVGAIGASLGAFIGSLYSSLNKELDFLFMVVPALDMSKILMAPPAIKFLEKYERREEILKLGRQLIELITPKNYRPQISSDKIHIVYHSHDLLTPASDARALIEQWKISHTLEIAGGHWIYQNRKARAKAWYHWLEQQGYIS